MLKGCRDNAGMPIWKPAPATYIAWVQGSTRDHLGSALLCAPIDGSHRKHGGNMRVSVIKRWLLGNDRRL